MKASRLDLSHHSEVSAPFFVHFLSLSSGHTSLLPTLTLSSIQLLHCALLLSFCKKKGGLSETCWLSADVLMEATAPLRLCHLKWIRAAKCLCLSYSSERICSVPHPPTAPGKLLKSSVWSLLKYCLTVMGPFTNYVQSTQHSRCNINKDQWEPLNKRYPVHDFIIHSPPSLIFVKVNRASEIMYSV